MCVISNSKKTEKKREIAKYEVQLFESNTVQALPKSPQRDRPSQLARLRLLSPEFPLFNNRSCGDTALIPR